MISELEFCGCKQQKKTLANFSPPPPKKKANEFFSFSSFGGGVGRRIVPMKNKSDKRGSSADLGDSPTKTANYWGK